MKESAEQPTGTERTGFVERETRETRIRCQVTLLDKTSPDLTTISTGIPFFDHMLGQLAFHGRMVLDLKVDGDLDVDNHHTVEDVGIVLGQALKSALGDCMDMERYGSAVVPMDEVLALCAVDVSGRPYALCECPFTVERIGNFETECLGEFLTAFSRSSGITVHAKILTPGNNHHMVEALFKSLAVAMRQAVAVNKQGSYGKGRVLPSTKGVL